MDIRELRKDEIRMAAELRHKCWNEDYAGILPLDYIDIEKETAYLTKWISDMKNADIRRLYGAFDKGDFIGFTGAGVADKRDAKNGVEIKYHFLKKEHRGKNVGIKLVKTVLDEYGKHGADELVIHNWHGSDSNRFYLYLGGEVFKQVMRKVGDRTIRADVFRWDLHRLLGIINEKLKYHRPEQD